MSNRRYLEIDSTYRNRVQDPKPGEFTVFISQSGTRGITNAYDPISLATPSVIWSRDDITGLSGTASTDQLGTVSEFVAQFAIAKNAVQSPDYYVGYPVTIGGDETKITSITFLNTDGTDDYFSVTVSPSLTSPPDDVTAITFPAIGAATDSVFFIPGGIDIDGVYNEYLLYNETKTQSYTITSYNGSTKLAGINIVGATTWATSDILSIRKLPPSSTGTFTSGSTSTGTSTTDFSTITDLYTGNFIRFTSGPNLHLIRRINSYDAASQTISFSSVTSSVTTDTFEILHFTRDNVVPFVYNGSTISQQNMVCYEIELLSLTIPRDKVLTSGGVITDYPYVYVKLQNASGAGSGLRNVIYSNNPHSVKNMFRASVSDVPSIGSTAFINISGDGMVQTVKFKPNDSLHFGVYLDNGDVVDTVCDEVFSPGTPNTAIQISALFSIKRL
jgi:hypothetical protein